METSAKITLDEKEYTHTYILPLIWILFLGDEGSLNFNGYSKDLSNICNTAYINIVLTVLSPRNRICLSTELHECL
jgi:hypothetical protein